MTESAPERDKDLQPQPPQKGPGKELDAAGKSLSEALRVSFVILKIIMIILVIFFLASGFRTVGSNERGLVLRFGKIRGAGEDRILKPGPTWILPYPIEEIVRIPAEKKTNLPINTFWYYESPSEMLPGGAKGKPRVPRTLNPIRDGYCITRSQEQNLIGSTGSDYNIVHCKWQLTYQIDQSEPFFKNIYIDLEDMKAGRSYADLIPGAVTPLLEHMASDAIATVMVNYTIDEALYSDERIPRDVKRLLQEKLDQVDSGIRAVSVQLTDITWPRQVAAAFEASISASQESERAVKEAETYAETTLNETGGPVIERLLDAIDNETVSEQEKEFLWSQLAGTAQEKIAEARAYRTGVVETAKANAEYLQKLLPEYRKRPKLVIQKLYQDAIEYVLNNADEKFIIQSTEGTASREIRIVLNRDETLRRKSE
jgi:membrane protease subunit HflK